MVGEKRDKPMPGRPTIKSALNVIAAPQVDGPNSSASLYSDRTRIFLHMGSKTEHLSVALGMSIALQ